jgi:hypothetical protein
MNLEILQDHINAFNLEIIDSGFKRDIDDYVTSLPSMQNNIVSLREIAIKVSATLERMYDGDLPVALSALLPSQSIRPFTESPHASNFKTLLEDTTIQQSNFFSQLNQNLALLKKQLQHNLTEIKKIQDFIEPYLSRESKASAEKDIATLSIAFKEERTISSLTQLTKTLGAWNRALPVYHQLLRSDSPTDIRIVEVQNGTIDLIINLNCDVALNLVELFKVGFQCYLAYLSYKTIVKQITSSYRGNPKLLKGEKEREKDLLDNIETAIEGEVNEQHNKAKKTDNKISGTSIKKKVEEITKLVTSHIVKGNDIKLLAAPKMPYGDEQKNDVADELRRYSTEARRKLRLLPPKERQLLLDKYSALPQDPEEKTTE